MASKFQRAGVVQGSTDVSTSVVLRDSSDSTEKTGVAHGSVTASYWRQGGTVTSITMASLTDLDDPHSDGGWKEVDGTNRPGEYRFDIPDAAFASGAEWVEIAVKVADCFVFFERFVLEGALNDLSAAAVNAEVDTALADYDPPTKGELDSGFAGLNDLSAAEVNAEVDTALGDYDGPTNAEMTAAFAALNDLSAAEVNAEVDTALADYDPPTKAEMDAALAGLHDLAAQDVRDAMKLAPSGGAPAAGSVDSHLDDIDAKTTNLPDDPADQSLIIAATDAIVADTEDIQSRLPAALVSGRMDSSVGAMTSAAVAAIWDALTSGFTTTGSIGKRIVDYLNAAISSRSTFDPATTPVEILATGGSAGKNAQELVDDIWDEDVESSHQTAGSAGKKLDDAGAAADPWSTPLPGSYEAGQAGKIVGDNLNATVSSRSSHTAAAAGTDAASKVLATPANLLATDASGDVTITQSGADKVWSSATRTITGLTSAAILSLWNQLTSGLTAAGSIGKKLADWVLGTDSMVKVSADSHTSGQTVAAVAGAVGSVTSGVNVTQIEGKTLDSKVGDNLNYFFHNGGGDTTKIVNDVGVAGSGLTVQQVRDAMKLAPTGGAPAAGSVDEHLDDIVAGVATPDVLVDTTIASITDQTHFTLTDGPTDDDAILNQAIVLYDVTNNDSPSVRKIADYVASTKAVTLDSAPDFAIATSDKVKVFVTAPGTTAPTAAQNADAVLAELVADHKGTSGSLADVVNRIRAATIGKKIVSDKANGTIKIYDENGVTLLRTLTIGNGATDDEVQLTGS